MIPLILRASALKTCVEIKYKDADGNNETEYLFTDPIGNWTELDFEGDTCMYASFLNTMVYKNVDVFRRLAHLLLDEILEVDGVCRIPLLNAMCILDPTFTPPWINVKCTWQRSLVMSIIDASYNLIDTCRNERRLEKYVTALQKLVLRVR